jgi:hypothetical protein
VFITMFRLHGDRICGFKSSFDDSAPLPPADLFLRIRCRSIVFMISGELPMDIDSRGALTDARIVPRIVPFNGLDDLFSFLVAHPGISRCPLIALCQLKSTQCTCSDHLRSPLYPPTSPASLLAAHIVGPLSRHPATRIGDHERVYYYVATVWRPHV